ncbi:transposase [Clostridium tagluense]|uniref:Transposase IS204/IS1001/IS1096/IS1165 DDE domain-containing protein n=1 Tax=Clostridium tagluense TaxID=360422 RepID=A0A401UKP8_9CLOT|nr:transposase [Clostridium tagluense]GCD10042.1 hypothetical protein Ctaglu_16650 [Clostridium tagluense]
MLENWCCYFEESSYLETAYELKEEFRDIYMLIDKNEAIDAFESWCTKVYHTIMFQI